MRRVYYSFALNVATSPVTLHLLLLAIAGYMLTVLVHVAAVLENLLAVQVGELGSYAVATVLRADVATLIVFGIVVMTALSLQWRLLVPRILVPRSMVMG